MVNNNKQKLLGSIFEKNNSVFCCINNNIFYSDFFFFFNNVLTIILGLICCLYVSESLAEIRPGTYESVQYFEINPNKLKKILSEFAIKTDCEIFYSSDIVEDIHSLGVRGTYTNSEALGKILENTGLRFERTNERIFLIHMIFAKDKDEGRENTNLKTTESSNFAVNWEVEEIIVTAAKRSQSVQDVAMSISVLGYTKLERRALVGMEDYLSAVVGVNQVDRGVGRNSIIIRGVAADPAFEDATVGVYFDEVPLTGRAYFGSADLKLVDMERVEILRGPQGTLYGANSLAGTVKNIPVEANLAEMQGHIKVGYSEMADEGSDGHKVTGVINIPIIDHEMALRVSAYRFENSGYIKNSAASHPASLAVTTRFGAPELAVNERDVGRNIYLGSRARMLWEPNNDLNVTINYLTQNLNQDGLPENALDLGYFQQARLQQGSSFGDGEELIDEIDLRNVVINYDFGWMNLLSSTSLLNEYAQRNSELSRVLNFPSSQFPTRDTRALIEEIRLASNFTGPLKMLVGLYFESSEKIDKVSIFYAGDPILNPLEQSQWIYNFRVDTKVDQRALFSELSYDVNDSFTFTMGTRFFSYDRSLLTVEEGQMVGVEFGSDNSPQQNSSESGDNIKLNITYTPNENSMIYAQYSEGFRLGGPQRPASAVLCDVDNDGKLDGTSVPIDTANTESDKIRSHELGGKYSGLDGRLIINGSLYYNDWTGIPVSVLGDCGIPIMVNAGKAKSMGADIESGFIVSPSIRIDAGVSFIDAQITKDVKSLMAVAGDRLAGSAKYSFNMALQYDFELMDSKSFIRADFSRVGGFYGTLKEVEPQLGNYNLLNLKAGIFLDSISAELYVNNLSNTKRLVWANGLVGYPLKPRIIGLDFSYHF